MTSTALVDRPLVLIIDDTLTNIETLVAVLEDQYELSAAKSGQQALALLAKGLQPDLILLDVMMPEMDGYKVCAALKADARWQGIPVIFVTARTDAASESKALSSGAVDFIHKPINPMVVRARVSLQLGLMTQRLELDKLNRQLAHSLIELEQANLRLTHLAQHDPLTQLPNRTLFFDRVKQGLIHAHRNDCRIGLLFIDLDRFKPINDTWGHAVGDKVLQEAAQRMVACVRASDTVGRVGGDEFVVLLVDPGNDNNVVTVAEKIRQALNRPFLIEGRKLCLSSSIGIAIAPDHGDNDIDLAARADEAMYHAKSSGRDRIRVYGSSTQTSEAAT